VPVSEDTTLAAAANLAVKFLLKLAGLALLAYWGAVVGSGVVAGATAASTVFAVLAVLNAIGLTVFRQWAE
jgi:hypothetical protein